MSHCSAEKALALLRHAVGELEALGPDDKDILITKLGVEARLLCSRASFECSSDARRLGPRAHGRTRVQPVVCQSYDDDDDIADHDSSDIITEPQHSLGRRRREATTPPLNVTSVMQLRHAFSKVDTNGNGQLDPTELHNLFKAYGKGFITEEVIKRLISEFDHDGNGQLNFHEFLKVWNSTSTHPVMMQAMRDGVQHLSQAPKQSQIGDAIYMLHPHAPVNADWELFMTLLLVCTVILLPISLGFRELGCKLRWVNLFIDICFIGDIAKHFCTGYTDENGIVILSRSSVASYYLRRGFLFDAVSSFPYDLIDFQRECGSNRVSYVKATRLLKLARLCRIMKIFRLIRVSKTFTTLRAFILHYEDKYHISIPEALIKMAQLLLLLLTGAHWIGCLQFWVVAEAGFPRDSWVRFADLHDAPVGRQYIWSYYKALSQMILIGFEVPSAVNQSCSNVTEWCAIEHWLTLLCLYFGAIFYSLLISSISMILLSANIGARNYRDKLQQVNEYMKSKALPAALRNRVKDYFAVQYAEGAVFQEHQILAELTPVLRNEILLYNARDLLAKVPLFCTFTHKLTKAFVAHLQHHVALEGDGVIYEGESGNTIFFISSGIFDISYRDVLIETIADGCYFGDCAVVIGCSRTATVRAVSFGLCYTIDRQGFNKALEYAPHEVVAYIQLVARSRYERMLHYRKHNSRSTLRDGSDEIVLEDQEDVKTEMYRDALRQRMDEVPERESQNENRRNQQQPESSECVDTKRRMAGLLRRVPGFHLFKEKPTAPDGRSSHKVFVQNAHDIGGAGQLVAPHGSQGAGLSRGPQGSEGGHRRSSAFMGGMFRAPEKHIPCHIARMRMRMKHHTKRQHHTADVGLAIFQRTLSARKAVPSVPEQGRRC